MVSSCGIYAKYPGDEFSGGDSPVALPSWRDFFADPCLQELIDSAMAGNTDLAVAAVRLHQEDEYVRASGLAYVPSLSLEPNGGISVKDAGENFSYQAPLRIGWNFGSPGTLFARRHQAQARRIQVQDNLDAVRNELISRIATDYYLLQMLDSQVEILENTVSSWTNTLEIQREYMLSGKAYYSSVAQMESKLLDAQQELLQARSDIAVWERAVCLLVARPHKAVRRSAAGEYPDPAFLESGVNFNQLQCRPDVRAAGRDLEIAYYVTSEARSAFFPSINLTGDFGWPELVNAAVSLVQPVFAQGALRSRLNVSKMDQDIARLQFNQTLLQAATEVSQAISDYRLNTEKAALFTRQQEIQTKACSVVEEISRDGRANYLELIKAQEKLLSAQLGKVQSDYQAHEAAIRLYKALGM